MNYRSLLYRIIGYSLLTIFIAVAITAPYLVFKLVVLVWAIGSIADTRKRVHAAEERMKTLETKQSAANQILKPTTGDGRNTTRFAIDEYHSHKKTQGH